MDIRAFVNEYAQKKKYYGLSCSPEVVHSLIKSNKEFAFSNQEHFENSEYLAYNIESCVKSYPRDKKAAIDIFKHFIDFLRERGVNEEVHFPPIDISNSFERLMFIAKYLQDPRHNIADLPKLLWISEVTIRADIRKLLGEDDDAHSTAPPLSTSRNLRTSSVNSTTICTYWKTRNMTNGVFTHTFILLAATQNIS